MGHLFLVEGPVGAGKSTFALALAHEKGGPRLTLDAWMTTLFHPDSPPMGKAEWYTERKERCLQVIWEAALEMMRVGLHPILELGLIQRSARGQFYELCDQHDCGVTVYIVDAPENIRRERVQRRNLEKGDTFTVAVPMDFFDLADRMWEPPDDIECRERDIRFVGPSS